MNGFYINMENKELLFSVTADDCDWMYFSAGGKGGQHQQRTASACRCRHKASGAEGISRDHREQRRNRVEAFKRMANSKEFQLWLKKETGRKLVSEEEQRRKQVQMEIELDKMMEPSNLRVEMKDENGKWTPYRETDENGN